jgi:hypothetical protein
MTHHRRGFLFAIFVGGLFFAGCTAVPEGVTKEQWVSMTPPARKEVLRKETLASTPMHRALAEDAAALNARSAGGN